ELDGNRTGYVDRFRPSRCRVHRGPAREQLDGEALAQPPVGTCDERDGLAVPQIARGHVNASIAVWFCTKRSTIAARCYSRPLASSVSSACGSATVTVSAE